MDKEKNVFDYCSMILTQYGFTVLIVSILAGLVGEEAAEVSAMFRLGSEGLSLPVLFQFFMLTIITVGLRYVFFTDSIIKRAAIPVRGCFMIASVLFVTAGFVILFDWFPVDNMLCWGMFAVSFALSTLTTMTVLSVKEKVENRQLEEALKRVQNGEEHRHEE